MLVLNVSFSLGMPSDMDPEFWKICKLTEEEKEKQHIMGYNKTHLLEPYFFSRCSNDILLHIYTNSSQNCVFNMHRSEISNALISSPELFKSPESVNVFSMQNQCEILGNEDATHFSEASTNNSFTLIYSDIMRK